MANRYDVLAYENDREADRLEGMAERFKSRGVRLHRIPGILEQAATLRKQASSLRKTGGWSKELYGQ